MSEYTEQVSLFEWAAWMSDRVPQLRLLFHIPNGELRTPTTGARLKALGTKRGIPDICLPVARRGYHGMYVELKVGANKPTKDQLAWLEALALEGYLVDVSYGWIEAAHKIVRYLGREPSDFGL